MSGALSLSDYCFEQLGYAPGAFEATAQAWRERRHPDDAAEVDRRIGEALAPVGSSYVCEYRMLDAQGHWRWILTKGQVLRRGPAREALLIGAVDGGHPSGQPRSQVAGAGAAADEGVARENL